HGSFGKSLPFEGESWYRDSLEGRLAMSDIQLDRERGESFFRISAPLVGISGRVTSVLIATVGTRAILSAVLGVSLGKTGECYLVSRNGTFLAHKEPERILTQNIAQSESFKNIFSSRRERITYIDYRGIAVIGSSARVHGTDWALVVEQDRDEAFQSADQLKGYILLVVLVSTLGALAAAWLLSRYIVLPIRKLSEAARSLAGGNFQGLPTVMDRSDEIGVLYDAFQDMAARLHDRQQRLEERVILREAELKQTDVRLMQTREAAARSQQLASLGQLAAGVAHEIRTPLTSIKMFLEGMETDSEMSPDFAEDLRVAMNQTKRMEATINRFLNFAKPLEPVFSKVDVTELVEDALLVVRPRANQQETIVRTEISRPLPSIKGDRKQLGEVLLNLLVNALEATESRGEIRVCVRTEEVMLDRMATQYVRIDIGDTGAGIREEDINRLFDPFFTTKATGTGLGLSMVYTTLKQHGGKVTVQSCVGKETVFSVFIPALSGETLGIFEKDGKDTDR
ncbi:MAG: HAMP domain-containing protein, partial [Deltaproteobacteria bacterium]|nr:HAMP domain-containing protein [Deltaproteobacteria bacterium]